MLKRKQIQKQNATKMKPLEFFFAKNTTKKLTQELVTENNTNQIFQMLIKDNLRKSQHFSQSKQQEDNYPLGFLNDHTYIQSTVKSIIIQDTQLEDNYKITSKYIIYELDNHVIILIGGNYIEMEIGDQVAIYIPQTYTMIKHHHIQKNIIKIQRRIVNNDQNVMNYPYFVYEPHQIIYPTLMCDWIQCRRRLTLKNYFLSFGGDIKYLLYGNIGHSLLQGLIKQQFSQDRKATYEKLYYKNLHEMYLINLELFEFTKIAEEKFQNLFKWYHQYIFKKKQFLLNYNAKTYGKITKVIGSQVGMKSRYFGIKGKIDLLLECQVIEKNKNRTYRAIVPFELKTGGKQQDQHIDQLNIYTLLINEKYKMPSFGLLYYPTINKLKHVFINPLTVYEICIKRNEVVQNWRNLFKKNCINLPQLTANLSNCSKCEYYTQCITTRLSQTQNLNPFDKNKQTVLDIQELSIESIENFQEKKFQTELKKLNIQQCLYISRWLNLLHLEEKSHKNDFRQLLKHQLNIFKIQQFRKFCEDISKFKNASQQIHLNLSKSYFNKSNEDILEGTYKKGEYVKIHIKRINLSQRMIIESVIKSQKKLRIILIFAKDDIKFDEDIVGYIQNSECQAQIEKFQKNFFPELRNNVKQLVMNIQYSHIKSFIVNQISIYDGLDNANHQDYYNLNIRDNEKYNDDQRQAIRKALLMQKFSLIQGMPGTGKTFIIVQLIQIFIQLGLKVLVTTYTNNSLDTILSRITSNGIIEQNKIIRQGSRSNIQQQNKKYYYNRKFNNIQQIQQYFQQKKVWFVTLASLNIQYIPKQFDIVIVDEASQCLEPVCLKSIFKAKKFILIGDYRQLQPLVKNTLASQKGMSTSLFQRLCIQYNQLSTSLTYQFRMCKQIMALSNELVYDNLLKVANEKIGLRRLQLVKNWQNMIPKELKRIVNPEIPIVVLNYDQIIPILKQKIEEQKVFKRTINRLQIIIASYFYTLLKTLGVLKQELSIISFYNSTTNSIVMKLRLANIFQRNDGYILTIDKSQGIDKQCIIFLIQDKDDENLLTENIRRLNVSLTRSKSKLIIVGSLDYAKKIVEGRLFKLLSKYQIKMDIQMLKVILKQK